MDCKVCAKRWAPGSPWDGLADGPKTDSQTFGLEYLQTGSNLETSIQTGAVACTAQQENENRLAQKWLGDVIGRPAISTKVQMSYEKELKISAPNRLQTGIKRNLWGFSNFYFGSLLQRARGAQTPRDAKVREFTQHANARQPRVDGIRAPRNMCA